VVDQLVNQLIYWGKKAEEAAVNRPSDKKPGVAVVDRRVDRSIYQKK